eukprot:9055301-Alexandrium_andersonii.AAC.1
MSASLVGSEMCIRDRTWSPKLPTGAFCALVRTDAECDEEACLRALRRHASVSYTHLTLPTICSV